MRAEYNTYRIGENGEKTRKGKKEGEFKIPSGAKHYRDYIDAYYDACAVLSPAAIANGANTVKNAMINDIINFPDTVKATGKTYYISNSGDDSRDGLSPETAWATTAKLKAETENLQEGDAVLFERGGIWRKPPEATLTEEILFVCKQGVSYGAYGKGRKPRFYGSTRNYADPALWEETEYPNVYKCTVLFKNAGVFALDHTESLGRYDERVALKEIVDMRGFRGVEDLRLDCSYYHQCEEQVIYFCSEKGNPGERFSSIEIGGRQPILRAFNPKIVENFELKFDGYGFLAAKYLNPDNGMSIRGCIFSYLGGCLGTPKTGRTTICGNAVEIGGPCNGLYVDSCWMYQLCDTGVTHQMWTTEGECIQKNIGFTGNVIEYCHWAIEFNNRDTTDGSKRTMENYYHSYNYLGNGGEGFGSVHFNRKERGTLYNCFGCPVTINGVCEKNILNTSAGPLYRMRLEGDHDIEYRYNVNIQTEGKKLGYIFDDDYYYDENAVKKLLEESKQTAPVFIVLE